MESKLTSKDSKEKRQIKEISQLDRTSAPEGSDYSEMNKIYKELYESRQQKNKSTTEETKEQSQLSVSINVPSQLLSSYLSYASTKLHFYVNKLSHYPKDQLKDNMVSFREMLFEDILKTRSLIPNEAPKRTLQAVFMTTFGFDSELLVPLLKAKVHLVVANDYQKNTPYNPLIENFDGIEGLNVIQPSKSFHGVFYSCFHPKLWLMKFPDFLRVVVSSGNLTTLDWSIWSNCLWYQDFYKKDMMLKETDKKGKNDKENNEFDYDKEFKETLVDYIKNIIPMKIDIKNYMKIDLDDYVFDNIDVILIPSYPGRHKSSKDSKYGLSKLRNIIKSHDFQVYQTKEEYVLTYQTSSLGTIDLGFLSDVCYSFLPNYDENSEDQKKDKLYQDITNNVKVIYPTMKYVVDESYAGPEFAHPLLLSEKNYDKSNFIKKVFHRFEGPDDYNFHHGILPHLKVGIVTKKDMKIDDDTIIYYGSHNFTSSAWGKYEKNRSQLSVSNTELGVLIPGKVGSKHLKEEIIKGLSFKFPAKAYEKEDFPWIASKHFKKEG